MSIISSKRNTSRINDSPCDLPNDIFSEPHWHQRSHVKKRAKFSNTAFRKMMDVSKDLVGRGFGDFT